MPAPGPRPKGDVAQRIHIRSCYLEDAVIGNSNTMSVNPGAAGLGGGAGPGDGGGDSKEPAEDTGEPGGARRALGILPLPLSYVYRAVTHESPIFLSLGGREGGSVVRRV